MREHFQLRRRLQLRSQCPSILESHIPLHNKRQVILRRQGFPLHESDFLDRFEVVGLAGGQRAVLYNPGIGRHERKPRAKAKVQGIVPPKDLRHTYASLLLSRYAPMGYVQEQLGHANMSTTLKYYHQYIQVPRGARYQAMLARLQEVMATGRHCDLLDFGESDSVSSANGFGPGTKPVVEGKFSTQTVTGTVTEPGEEGAREESDAPLSALESYGEPCRNRTYNLLIESQDDAGATERRRTIRNTTYPHSTLYLRPFLCFNPSAAV